MQNAERRLSAILCADVVGYSRLVRMDEVATLARLNEARTILQTAIDENGGRVFNLAGDGLLAEFPSAVAAVQAAAASQDRLAPRAASQPDDRRMHLRIGVNLADVVVDGNDLLGDGVNVAARLQALAEPGGVCISGAVYEQTRGRLALPFVELDQQPMKNIADPMRVYALQNGVTPSSVDKTVPPGPLTVGRILGNPRRARVLRRLAGIVIILSLLLVINLMTTPHRIWVHWPALGMGAALVLSELRRWLWSHPWLSNRLPD
jgi:adenylate cyclase